MENTRTFFAVDLGATSGRTITGTLSGDGIQIEELTRFGNAIIETGGHYYWDIYALYNEVIGGLRTAARRGIHPESIGIDTWGVDFVCVGKDGALLRNPLSYRDPHTFGKMEDYLEQVIDRKTVYDITGIQFMNFNTLFQLYAMRCAGNSALEHADKLLFMPDALSWMLTGNMVCEYTIASTGQLLDPRTGRLDERLLDSVGLSAAGACDGRPSFAPMVLPGHVVGTLTAEVQRQTGLGAVPVIAVAGHDTASAVAAVPARDERFAYLSSGTWSLMGIETRSAIINDRSYELNFTNEGGIEGTTRFLKNICGMWLLERCRKEWTDAPSDYGELMRAAMAAPAFRSLINPDDASFANPTNMQEAIRDYCRGTGQPVPEGYAAICRCIFESLALRYRQVFGYLKEMSSQPIDVLHIIGGGSRNRYLNRFTADATGVTVMAGPQECTALGNIMIQAKAAGAVSDIWHMRRLIASSISPERYEPRDGDIWARAYARYIEVTKQ